MCRVQVATRFGAVELRAGLDVEPGRCLALAGPSGAGKTTLLRIVAGLARPRRGRVEADGETWFDSEHAIDVPAEQRRVGFVFQDYALFPHLSARDNVAYATRDANSAEQLLDRLGIDPATAARRPRDLSGGERQRVALARALARDPAVLLLDEPLAAPAPRTRARATRHPAHATDPLAAPA